MTTLTEMPSAAARARYRAVVARVDAIWRQNQRVECGGVVEGWDHGPLSNAALDALEHIRLGAVRTLRALGEPI